MIKYKIILQTWLQVVSGQVWPMGHQLDCAGLSCNSYMLLSILLNQNYFFHQYYIATSLQKEMTELKSVAVAPAAEGVGNSEEDRHNLMQVLGSL